MSAVSNTIFNMSITGSVVILVVILIRFVLQKVPKKYSYILWSVAGFRLCCPFSFESVVSLFNINPIQNHTDFVSDSGTMNYIDVQVYTQTPQTNIGTIIEADAPATVIVQNHFTDFIPYIWILGLIFLVAIGIINFVKIRKQLLTATKKCDNIYQSESISSPFILGIIKPKIYIPYSIDEEYFDYVIAHERYHLKRRDNIIKLFAFLLLCVHWFNPFCWLAFYLVNKDMEMSCDEWVLRHNDGIKKAYSNALLSFATEKNILTPTPLCFVEGSAKSRIKNVLKYKKPAVIVSIIAIILCIAVTVVCIANPTHNVGDALPPGYYMDNCYQRIEEKVVKANAKPSEYKTIAAEEFKELENDYNNYSLNYVYERFLWGNQTGIKANAMLIVMNDLIGAEQIKTTSDDPQACFNEFLLYNVDLLEKNNITYMEKYYPNGYTLMNCLDSRIDEICNILTECLPINLANGGSKEIEDKTHSKYVGDVTSGVYSWAYKCGNTISFVIIELDKLYVHFSVGQKEYISKELFTSSQTNDTAAFDFVYDYYWYNVIQDDDNTRVVCSKYNDDYTIDETVYTIDKSGKWSTKNEKCQFSFDENNTINIYSSDNGYSRAWWYINTETESIEERDKNTANGKVIQTLMPLQENSVSGAQKAIAVYQKPYQYINAHTSATTSWSNGKITVDLGENKNPQLRWTIEDGVSIKSAELVISIDGKEVFTEPMSIKDVRNENPNNHIWDYLAYTQKDKYVLDCKNKESICEVYAKCFDDRGAEYHVYLTPTKFNTENDASAYTYILYNGYEFWY